MSEKTLEKPSLSWPMPSTSGNVHDRDLLSDDVNKSKRGHEAHAASEYTVMDQPGGCCDSPAQTRRRTSGGQRHGKGKASSRLLPRARSFCAQLSWHPTWQVLMSRAETRIRAGRRESAGAHGGGEEARRFAGRSHGAIQAHAARDRDEPGERALGGIVAGAYIIGWDVDEVGNRLRESETIRSSAGSIDSGLLKPERSPVPCHIMLR